MPESWWNNKVKVSRHDTNLVKESTFQVKAFLLFLKNENGKETIHSHEVNLIFSEKYILFSLPGLGKPGKKITVSCYLHFTG